VEEVRASFADLLMDMTKNLLVFERDELVPAVDSEDEMDTEEEADGLVHHLVKKMFHLLEYDDMTWKYFDQYFNYFIQFAQQGDNEMQYLLNISATDLFIPFFLEDEDNNAKKLTKRGRLKRKGNTSNFANMVTFVASIVCHCETDIDYGEDSEDRPPTQCEGTIFKLTDIQNAHIRSKEFLSKLFLSGVNIEETWRLMAHLTWSDNEATESVLSILIEDCIRPTEYSELKPMCDLLSMYLKQDLNDSMKHRTFFALDLLLKVMNEKRKYPKKTRELIVLLKRITDECPLASKWVDKNQYQLGWINSWIEEHQDVMNPSQ